jgi:ribosomal protein S18 acetylase RimI-like enzyme
MENKESIIIKKASFEDIPLIKKITIEAFENYIRLADLNNNLEALQETEEDIKNDLEKKCVFIAFIDGFAVGAVRIQICPDKTAYLSRFAVSPLYQNNGVGKVLMDTVDSFMKENNTSKLCLHTASKVSSIVCFYYRCGFYVDSTCKDRGYVRALMCKEY